MMPNLNQSLYGRFKKEGYRIKKLSGSPVSMVSDLVQLAYLDVNRTIRGINPDQSRSFKQVVVSFIESLLANPPATQAEFDQRHHECCQLCLAVSSSDGARIHYGQAQKLLNMSLKYLYNEFAAYAGSQNHFGFPDSNVEHFFHLPIDSQIRNYLVGICAFADPTSLPWSQWAPQVIVCHGFPPTRGTTPKLYLCKNPVFRNFRNTMPASPYLVHVDDVTPENMQKGDGWAISEFRLPVTGAHGSATTIFHSIFRPGSTHAKHLHAKCDEIAVYIKGHGIVGQSDQRTQVGPGHCRLMPAGSPHFFHNETKDQDGLVIGFYMGAKSVPDTGYQFCGHVAKADLEMPRAATLTEGILLNVADVKPLALSAQDGWNVSDFRLPIGKHNGSAHNAQFWAKLAPGDVHHKHRFDRAEVLYYVVQGSGIAGAGGKTSRVRGGHVHFIPKGVEHFIANTGNDTLELIGVYTGAGSIEDAGYVYTGKVTNSDLCAN